VPPAIIRAREISLRPEPGYACPWDDARPKLLNQLGRHERCLAHMHFFSPSRHVTG